MGMVVHIKQVHRDQAEHADNTREFFLRHEISTKLMLLVKKYLEHNHAWEQRHTDSNQKKVLQFLPEQLQKSLAVEMRMPTVQAHCLFTWLRDCHIGVLRSVCL